ncbi:MAG: DEAD/DEAH box helicase [Chitinophagaceae bacterium]
MQQSFSIEQALKLLNIEQLNAMQQASLEANKTGKDIVLLSNTGSGKTLAFLLPLMQILDKNNNTTQALIIVPSRELALQIEQVYRSLGTGMKVTLCYGGHKREIEEQNLVQAPVLIIGTPGRLADHIRRGNIQTDSIQTLILDEFDKSLELGFQDEMSFVIGSLPGLKKRVLTSATEAIEVPKFIGLQEPERLNFLTGEAPALAIQQIKSPDRDKSETLFRLVCMLGNRSMVIFCNYREIVEEVSAMLSDKGIVNVFYHGAMEQRDREVALCKFRNGTSNILVTTDLASRGLDIPNIRYIIHYQLPGTEETFTHRNGRTARMDASGTAIMILSSLETLPPYLDPATEEINLPETAVVPEKPKWTTLFIDAGKKDKINKIDIVGFLTQKGELKKDDLGLIEVKDFFAFAAVRKTKASAVLTAIKGQRIKNKKVAIHVAK